MPSQNLSSIKDHPFSSYEAHGTFVVKDHTRFIRNVCCRKVHLTYHLPSQSLSSIKFRARTIIESAA
jgi:hypothetical protein